MVGKPSANREFNLAIAMTSLAFELSVPILAGWLVDQYLGRAPVGILVGAVTGMTLVLVHALRLGNLDQKTEQRKS